MKCHDLFHRKIIRLLTNLLAYLQLCSCLFRKCFSGEWSGPCASFWVFGSIGSRNKEVLGKYHKLYKILMSYYWLEIESYGTMTCFYWSKINQFFNFEKHKSLGWDIAYKALNNQWKAQMKLFSSTYMKI